MLLDSFTGRAGIEDAFSYINIISGYGDERIEHEYYRESNGK